MFVWKFSQFFSSYQSSLSFSDYVLPFNLQEKLYSEILKLLLFF